MPEEEQLSHQNECVQDYNALVTMTKQFNDLAQRLGETLQAHQISFQFQQS